MSGGIAKLRRYIEVEYGFTPSKTQVDTVNRLIHRYKDGDKEMDIMRVSEFDKFRKSSAIESLDALYLSQLSNYDKARGTVYLCMIFGGWYNVTLIPAEVFLDFYKLSENIKYGVYMDESKDYQYFRVVKMAE